MIEFFTYHTPLFYLIQSVWRDEAFSYFMAKPNIFQVIINTANDFNPPLYYILLHYWISIFGKSDVALRMLSYIPHLLTAFVAYKFARSFFTKRFAIFVSLFTFFNPMLLYYAFEMRMYSFYALFALCSLYFFHRKKWTGFIISSVLGLYTHSFFPLVILSFLFYLILTRQTSKKLIIPTVVPLLFYIPWLPILIKQFINSKDSWMFPVDFQLVRSVLGNIFTSYEGTPGDWWGLTSLLSGLILIFILLSIYLNRKVLSKMKLALLFFLPVFLPLILILGYSILRRPIYVNRYLIFVAVFEIMSISLAIGSIKNKLVRSFTAIFWFVLIIIINIVLPPFHKKTDFKNTFAEINKLAKPEDYVFSKTPIGFLESAYYYKYPGNIYVYNPQNISIPNYIGVNLVYPHASKPTFPPYLSKTFLIGDDAGFELIMNNNQI